MKKLLIVESPSKCAKIESFIPCRCISSKGHIRELKKLPKPGEEPIYELIPEKKSHIESMKKVIKTYSPEDIYVATDDDREGEAIAWHICQVFGLPVETTKRIIFHEVTKSALEKAVLSPGVINMDLVKAQKTRQVLDLMVGFKVSPLLWKNLYMSRDNSLSAGRCQTPALRLVYDNAKAPIELKQTYKITGFFFPKKVEFELSRELATKEETVSLLTVSKGFRHVFSMGVKKISMIDAPKPFNTSALLQAASSGLRMSPKEVMAGCQQLYQDGHITYMRTESQTYCAEYLGEVSKFIREKWDTEKYLGDLSLLENRDAGNPHEAIRVTHLEVESVEATGRVGKLYQMIWRNSVESCMSACKMEQTPVYMSAPIEKAQYIHRIEVPLFWGWKAVSIGDVNTVSLAETGAALLLYMTQSPKEQEAQKICAKVAVHGRRTHYTEASLIKRLEDIGIGRPSTYASLVDTIIERGYVKKMDIDGDIIACSEYVLEKGRDIVENQLEKRVGQEKGKLVIQPVGILVAEFLTEHFGGLFDYDYTKGMELELDKIAAAEGKSKDLCGECDTEIERMILPIEKQRFVIKDNVDNYVVMGRYGPVIQKKGSRELTGVRKDIDMERLKAGDYSLGELLEKKDVDEIGVWEGEPVILKSGPFGQYVCYKEEKISLNILGLEKGATQEEIYSAFMTKKTEVGVEGEDKKVIRELSAEMSIRNGKYGAYIHYFKQGMKKPKFFALKGFKESYRLCQKEVLMEWIAKTHGL